MTLHPSVLITLRRDAVEDTDIRTRIASTVRRLGFDAAVAHDGREALAWVRERSFAATFVECGVEGEAGVEAWRAIQPHQGRRLVLMIREPDRALWFEALGRGVGAVLPLPPAERMVRAALRAATGWDDCPEPVRRF